MSLFNTMFGNKPQQPQEPTPPPAAENNTVPTTQNTPPESPLNKFEKLWEPSTTQQDQPLQFNADPAKLMEAAKGLDFTSVVPKELFAQVAQGGEAGTNAMMQALNLTAQAGYAQSAQATTAIVQKALEMQQEQFLKQLPSIIKSQSVTEQLSSNPLLSNPATRPILDAVKQQLVTKFPDASSSEITKFANEYLTEFAKQISGPQAATTAGGAPKAKDFDWSEHFFGKA